MYDHFEHGRRAVFVVATAAALGACTPQAGQVYALPIQEVRKALESVSIPPHVFGSAEPDFRIETTDPLIVNGIVGRGRDEMMRYVITLVSVNDRSTRVTIKLSAAKSGPFGNVERSLAEHPAIANLYRIAMEERVAATLTRRPYDMSKIYPALALATAANVGAMKAQVDSVAAAENKRARDNIDKAYAEEAAGRRLRP